MSREIDERVVEMRFDNSAFERGVAKTLETIQKLKDALKFEGATKGLEEIQNASEISFDDMYNSVNSIAERFSYLGLMGMRAITNITDRIVNMGIATVKSMTFIDQMAVGWQRYAQKTSAVQTIMAATRKEFGDVDNQMELVNEQLEKLYWFTDETSYDSVDLINNIAKFTSNNVKLETAVTAMQGLALATSVAGGSANEFSRAAYNLAQSLGSGTVRLQDWMSIENANIATAEFKETMLDAAVAAGKLKKVSDGVWRTMKGSTVTVENFRNTLQEGWFSADTLMKGLDEYGRFASELRDTIGEINDNLSEDEQTYATEMLRLLKTYKRGNLNMEQTAERLGMSVDQLREKFDNLTRSENDLGMRAMQSGQEAKTFAEVLQSARVAVASGWGKTFEYIFGNYEEAKELFTDLSEVLYDTFAEGGNRRNAMLKAWYNAGGRDELIEGFWNIYDSLYQVFEAIGELFREFFPSLTSDNLLLYTYRFKEFSKAVKDFLVPSEQVVDVFYGLDALSSRKDIINNGAAERLEKIKKPFEALFKVLELGKTTVQTFIKTFQPLIWKYIVPAAGHIFNLVVAFSEWVIKLVDVINESKIVQRVFSGVFEFITGFVDKVIDIGKKLNEVFKPLEKLQTIGDGILNWLEKLLAPTEKVKETTEESTSVFDIFGKTLSIVNESLNDIWGVLTKLGSSVGEVLIKAVQTLRDMISNIFDLFKNDNPVDTIYAIGSTLAAVFTGKWLIDFAAGFKHFADIFRGLKLEAMAGAFFEFAKAIGLVAASVWLLSTIDSDRLMDSVTAILALMAGFAGAIAVLNKSLDEWGGSDNPLNNLVDGALEFMADYRITAIAKGILAFGEAIVMLAVSLKVISTIDSDKLLESVVALLALVAGLTIALKTLKTGSGGFNIALMAGMIRNIGVALLLMAAAIKVIGGMEMDNMIVSVLAILALLAGISKFINSFAILEKGQKAQKIGGTLIAIGLALVIISKAVKILGSMDTKTLVVGLGSVAAILVALDVFVNRVSEAKIGGVGVGLLLLSAAMVVLAGAMKIMGSMKLEKLGVALLSMVSALMIFGLAVEMLSAKDIAKGGGVAVALIALSAAMIAMAAAITILGSVNIEKAGMALLIFAGTIVSLGAAVWLLDKMQVDAALIKVGLGILAMSAAIAVGAIALAAFSVALSVFSVNLAVIVRGIANVISALAEGIAQSATSIAKAVVAIIVAIVQTLADNVGTVVAGVGNLIVNFITALNDWIGPVVTAAIIFAFNFIMGLAEGIRTYSPLIIMAVLSLIESILEVAFNALEGLAGMIPVVGEDIVAGLEDAKLAMRDLFNVDDAATQAEEFADGVSTSFSGSFGDVEETAANEKTNILNAMTFTEADASQVTDSISGLGGNILTSFQEAVPDGALLGISQEQLQEYISGFNGGEEGFAFPVDENGNMPIVGNVLSSLQEAQPQFAEAGGNEVDAMVNGEGGMLATSQRIMPEAGTQVSNDGVDGADRAHGGWVTSGYNCVQGLVDGIHQALENRIAWEAGHAVGKQALEGAMAALDENSPSKEFMKVGRYADEGLVIGLNSMARNVFDAGSGIGENAMNGLRATVKKISDTIFDVVDPDPVIRPTLDLSGLTSRVGEINDMFGQTYGVNGSGGIQNGGVSSGGIVFNQYNNSPKALSQIEIYRQTRNQLSYAKGILNS